MTYEKDFLQAHPQQFQQGHGRVDEIIACVVPSYTWIAELVVVAQLKHFEASKATTIQYIFDWGSQIKEVRREFCAAVKGAYPFVR